MDNARIYVGRAPRDRRKYNNYICNEYLLSWLRAWPVLLRLRDHVVDGGLHVGVGERGVAALGRHHSLLAREALECMLIERRLALRNARTPVRLVAHLGCTGDTRAMA